MIVVRTAGIERRPTTRARVDVYILGWGQTFRTDATADGWLFASLAGPRFGVMSGEFLVTPIAGVVLLTAVEFECDDIAVGVIMCTAGFPIESNASDVPV